MSVKTRDSGAVLLTTLLIMSLIATVAVSLFEDLRFAVKRAVNVQAYAQADWHLRGADMVIEDYLASQLKDLSAFDLNAILQNMEPIIFPVDGGTIEINLRSGDDCFALNSLAGSPGRIQFRQLLETLGWDTLSAATITTQAADWIDADSQALPGGAEDYAYLDGNPAHRTANTAYTSVSELRALRGLDEAGYQRIRPFLCTRRSDEHYAQGQSFVNVNALSPFHAPLLASILTGADSLGAAQMLINDRPAAGYSGAEQWMASAALSGVEAKNIAFSSLSFETRYVYADVRITFGGVSRYGSFEYNISSGKPKRVLRRLGLDARRAVLIKAPS